MLLKLVHPLNALDSISVIVLGRVIDSKLSQPLKALNPIETTPSGIDIIFKLLQPSKALWVIIRTDGNETLVMFLQFSKAPEGMPVLFLWVMVTFLSDDGT